MEQQEIDVLSDHIVRRDLQHQLPVLLEHILMNIRRLRHQIVKLAQQEKSVEI